MQSKKDELGIKGAFTSAGFNSSSDWRFKTHLANLPLYYEFKDDNITEQPATIKGTYLPEYKNIFDLYITDSTTEPSQLSSKTGDDANSEFALGEAAFYQNGTWAWSDLQKAGMEVDSVVKLLFSGKRVFPIPIKRIDFHPAQRIAYAKVTLYPYVLAGVGG